MANKLTSNIKLALYAGLTSLFTTLLYEAVEAFYALPLHDKIEQLETIAIVTVGSLLVLDPFLDSILASIRALPADGEHHRELGTSWVRLIALVVIVFVGVCDGLLHEYLGHAISSRGLIFGIEQLVSSLLGPTIITFAWLRGLTKTPPRAARYGLIAGILLGIFVFSLVTAFAAHYAIQRTPTVRLEVFDNMEAWAVLGFEFLWVTLTVFFPGGFLGGLAADRGWCAHAWQRVLIGLAAAAIVQPLSSLVTLYYLTALAQPQQPPELSVVGFVIPALTGNIGWALAFYLDADADALLAAKTSTPDKNISLNTEATKLIEAAALMFVCATAVGMGSLLVSHRLTADMLKRGTHPIVSLSPKGKAS
jgi:hypothetical protein